MAHELDFAANGEAAMAWVGDTPWHGLGQELEAGSPIEVWLKAAHMDWEILRTPVEYKIPYDGSQRDVLELTADKLSEYRVFVEKNVLYRSDTLAPLSVVSDSYNIVQPYEVLEFYRDLVGVADMQLETAGVLFGGRRFWALANTGRLAELKGDDAVKGYVLLSTSCDGTMATTARFTSVRVVCNNTLSIATKDNASVIRVPHRRVWNPNEVKEQLGLIDSSWAKFKEHIEVLSNTPVTTDMAADYLVRLFGEYDRTNPPIGSDEWRTMVSNQSPAVASKCAGIWDLYTNSGVGAHMPSAEGTFWGLLNAITQTIDYHTGHRTVDARLNNAWFGQGNAKKSEAFELALEYAND
jgi:phage/plasmid-like protein (TIGR03299 family)